ncbi:hypothetical protein CC78DRAFT_536405 [Lojkania enalia]|uniref:Uncharacterized protein n=1 Tax=Lojkania enalia TaxID=147567 RepID=A0A9P4K1G2_9PLEO|nr:hypothetical protein CC78DRAFT_536405 [Didymosphaeria enalia]
MPAVLPLVWTLVALAFLVWGVVYYLFIKWMFAKEGSESYINMQRKGKEEVE